MKILIVIDMQPGFMRLTPEAYDYVHKIAELADDYDLVVGVEFEDFCDTDPQLRPLFHHIVEKERNDGSDELHNLFHHLELSKKKNEYHVVGMYLEYCVYETVAGLMGYGYNVKILGDYCIPQCHPASYSNVDHLVEQFEKVEIIGIPDGWEQVLGAS